MTAENDDLKWNEIPGEAMTPAARKLHSAMRWRRFRQAVLGDETAAYRQAEALSRDMAASRVPPDKHERMAAFLPIALAELFGRRSEHFMQQADEIAAAEAGTIDGEAL